MVTSEEFITVVLVFAVLESIAVIYQAFGTISCMKHITEVKVRKCQRREGVEAKQETAPQNRRS